MRVLLLALSVLSLTFAGPVAWQSEAGGGRLTVTVEGMEVLQSVRAGETFSIVEILGAGISGNIGEPGVPVYRELVEVPYGAEVEVYHQAYDVREYGLEHRLLPRQASRPKTGPEPEFALDEKSYGRDEFLGGTGASVTEAGIARGHRLVLVEVFPAGYNPAGNVLRVAERIEVSVSWTGADWSTTRRRAERYDSRPFRGRLDGVTVNRDQFDFAPPELPIGYLVIVPDGWETNVMPLAEWRRRRGYSVFVRNLTQVGGGSANAVRSYIQDAYDDWPIPPSMVLLVGDIDNIGFFTGQGQGSPNTDLNFSMLEGSDYLPDIDLSRASLTSAAQLDTFIGNVLAYEQVGGTAGSEWLNRAYFIASSDGGNHQVAEGTHQYVMAKLRPMGVECDSQWLYHGQGTPILTALHGGRSWVTYSGHGNTDRWADCSFTVSDVHNLDNTDKIPYVQTYACLSGDFASTGTPECFSEAWIRSGRRGGIAYIASTVNSYWTEDDTLERRVFDCMFDSSMHWIMGGYNKAKLIFFEQFGATPMTRRYLEMYNMMGDGAIDIFAHEPAELTVLHPPVIPLGSYPIPVTVTADGSPVPDAMVCAMAKDDTTVFAVGYTDAGGQVTLNVNNLAPDSVYVTVTGHDLEPYLGAALALPSSGAYVMYFGHTVDDSAGGNNDGVINPGEAINLQMWLKNWGSETANAVETRLRTDDANIILTDSVKQFGNIAAGDSAHTGADGFGFEVDEACTNRYALRFTVRSNDANDSVWETPLALTVGAPVLGYESWQAQDPPPGGNGNGMIEPGETGDLMVTLRNTGHGNAYGVTAVLKSGDSRLVVLDSTGSFGDIMRDTTGTNTADRFRVQADNSIPRESQLPCTLYITVGGATYVRDFMLGIGVIRVVDPIPDNAEPTRYYAFDDGDEGYVQSPEFEWIDIEGMGTRLTLSDDQTITVTLPSGFGPFVFYGQDFTQLSICGNGFIAPGATTVSTYTNTELPSTSPPSMMAVNWDDLYPPNSNGVWWYHDEANHRFIIQYDSMPYYASRETFEWNQVIIYDTTMAAADGNSVFTYQYLTANQASSATVGEQDPTKVYAIQALFDETYHRGCAPLDAGRAILFTTDSPTTGIAGPEPKRAIRGFSLATGTNPVRGDVRLRFSIPFATEAKLTVYDAGGRKVASLLSGAARPGEHVVTWDRRDSQGRQVARGIYLVRLEAGSETVTRKAILLD